jgi:hypothetical protein
MRSEWIEDMYLQYLSDMEDMDDDEPAITLAEYTVDIDV